MTPPRETTARLLISCPDRPGIIAAVTGFLYRHGANCTALDQHATDRENGVLFMRLEFQTPHLDVSRSLLEQAFADEVAVKFDMRWRLSYATDAPRMAIFVSKHDHVLMDLLWRLDRGDLYAEIAMVISNHPDLEEEVARFGIPYYHVPMVKGEKHKGEARMLEVMGDGIDVIVLARYMQILSASFVDRYANRIINIHHSFLPAFAGADPYRQGPEDLRRLGRDVERSVLARAVRWHLEDRLIVHKNKTVVFV